MPRAIPMAVLFVALMLLAQPTHAANWLKGRVYENRGDKQTLAVGAQVWIVHVGNPNTTGPDGAYQVFVPDAIRFGQTIELFVKRKGWAIAIPVGGKVELLKELTADIHLSPDGSSEFLSPEQLGKLLESLPEKLKGLVKPDGKEGEVDPVQVVKEYAIEHGLPEGEVSTKVAALVKQYEQASDLGKQCLAAVYGKNLEQVAIRCKQSATNKVDLLKKKRQEVEALSKNQLKSNRPVEFSLAYAPTEVIHTANPGMGLRAKPESRQSRDMLKAEAAPSKSTPTQLEEARRQLIKITEEVVGEFRTTGDTFYANYQFDKALKAYKEGLDYVEKKDLPTLWANMQWLIGLANQQIGIRTEGPAIRKHLAESVNNYRDAQTVYTKDEFREAFSTLQMNLGTVLSDQGLRTDGKESLRLLALAEAAYRDALSVHTKDTRPQDWARTQMNLGTVLSDQGSRTSGANGLKLFAQAVESFGSALSVYTKRDLPQQWTATVSNLTEALFLSGQHVRTRSQLDELLVYEGLDTDSKIALLYISIANSVGLGERKQALTDFETISHSLGQQGADFFLTWDFSSIRASIPQNQAFGKHRPWLLNFLSALEHGRRDEMLAATGKARNAFLKISTQ